MPESPGGVEKSPLWGQSGDSWQLIEPGVFSEGGIAQRKVTIFERSRKAREACLEQFGTRCFICQFDFAERYGSSFARNIPVHHLSPISFAKLGFASLRSEQISPMPSRRELAKSSGTEKSRRESFFDRSVADVSLAPAG
jgi:hypothetical protein